MTAYRLVLFLHILMALITFGVGGVLHAAMFQMRSAFSAASVGGSLHLIRKLEPLFPFSALGLFLAGAYLVHSSWQWTDGWIVTSIVGLVIMEIVGVAVLKKGFARIDASFDSAEGATEVPETLRAATLDRAVWIGAHFNSFTALGIVFLMTVKPSLPASIVALALFALAGVASAVPFTKPVAPQPADA